MQQAQLSTATSGVRLRSCPPAQPRPARRQPRGGRPAAASAQQVGGGASVQPAAGLTLEELRGGLQEAIKAEDYATAARIRDRIAEHEQEDPMLQAAAQLAAAVAEQRFEDAAALRDQMKKLSPQLPPAPPALEAYDTTAPTTSDTVTDGVRVTCRSFFVPSESTPASGKYFFGYSISIRNEGKQNIKLMERYWHITNGQGLSQEVRGPGVIGEQPELAPGQSFQYQSACPLPTPRGVMEGHYEFYAKDEETGQWTKSFLVKIGPFTLRAD